ncbi:MAG: hypothetical protein EPN34_03225 [Burkholderiaceae bacterium]|nr:MAG: hypothetical protein EPN34_03225 [Burkholderiaceae bacterium]
MTPNWTGWQADAILLIGLIVLAVYLWRMAKVLAEVNHQQKHMQQRIDQLPGTELMTDLRLQLGRMEALGESTQREIHATGARLRRVEDYLMEAKRHGDDV